MQVHIDYQIARARASAAHISLGNSASVAVAADDVTSALQRLYRDRSIAMGREFPDDHRAACDRQDLNEILANLLDSAFKHSGSQVNISARADSAGQRLTIYIDDDGPGLPPEARDLVFNIGERWDSQVPGSGLGLAIPRDLARLYGGTSVWTKAP